MLKLDASYSKKVPAEGEYTSQSYHASIEVELPDGLSAELENEFLTLETVCENLKIIYLKNDDEARSRIVRAAELGAINSSDIVPVFKEFKNPRHEEFAEPTRWSLLNAFTETIKKYTPQRVDHAYSALNHCFGLDGKFPALWK